MPGLGIGAGTAFRQDILANRPVAEPSIEGFFFFATDTDGGTFYQCTGIGWVAITNGIKSIVAGTDISIVNTPTTITINNTYTLPIASASVLGGIKVGSGLFVNAGGTMSLDLPPDIAYTDHINNFIKEQFITFPDNFQAAGLSISVTGINTVGLDVYSEDVSAITATSRSPIATSGIPAVDVFANGICMRLVQGLDTLDAPNTKPAFLVQRSGATNGANVYSGALIAGSDFTVGSQISTGPLLHLSKFTVPKFVIGNVGDIQTVSGVTPSDGQLLIGNTSAGHMTVSTLTAGSNISITNSSGGITIASTAVATTETIKHGGSAVGTRPTINFIDGTNVTLTVADNGGTNAVDVTIASTAAAASEGIQHGGSLIGTRPTVNFIDGTNVTLTIADNPGSNRVDVTVASTGGGSGETIKHTGTTVGTRPNINLIDGTNVTLTVADNSGTNSVDVTITAGSVGGGGIIPSVKATNTVATTVTSGISNNRSIPFNTTLYDQGTGTPQHSTVTNTDRLTCRTSGIYIITATIWWTNNSTGIRELEIDKIRISDGADVTLVVDSIGASSPSAQEVTVQAQLVAGDYLLAIVTQTSGGNLDIISDSSGEYAQSFSMTRIG